MLQPARQTRISFAFDLGGGVSRADDARGHDGRNNDRDGRDAHGGGYEIHRPLKGSAPECHRLRESAPLRLRTIPQQLRSRAEPRCPVTYDASKQADPTGTRIYMTRNIYLEEANAKGSPGLSASPGKKRTHPPVNPLKPPLAR